MFPPRPRRLPARTHGDVRGAGRVGEPTRRGTASKFAVRATTVRKRLPSHMSLRRPADNPRLSLSWGTFPSEPATWWLDWSLAAPPASRERFARQHPSERPSRFPRTSLRAGVDRHLSGIGETTRPDASREPKLDRRGRPARGPDVVGAMSPSLRPRGSRPLGPVASANSTNRVSRRAASATATSSPRRGRRPGRSRAIPRPRSRRGVFLRHRSSGARPFVSARRCACCFIPLESRFCLTVDSRRRRYRTTERRRAWGGTNRPLSGPASGGPYSASTPRLRRPRLALPRRVRTSFDRHRGRVRVKADGRSRSRGSPRRLPSHRPEGRALAASTTCSSLFARGYWGNRLGFESPSLMRCFTPWRRLRRSIARGAEPATLPHPVRRRGRGRGPIRGWRDASRPPGSGTKSTSPEIPASGGDPIAPAERRVDRKPTRRPRSRAGPPRPTRSAGRDAVPPRTSRVTHRERFESSSRRGREDPRACYAFGRHGLDAASGTGLSSRASPFDDSVACGCTAAVDRVGISGAWRLALASADAERRRRLFWRWYARRKPPRWRILDADTPRLR